MKVGPSQAAKMAGVARSTIYKDIEGGKLSAVKDGKSRYKIDVSELTRVYGGLRSPDTSQTSEDVRSGQMETLEKDNSDRDLNREIESLRERLAEKESQLSERAETITDLRGERDRLLKVIEEQAGSVKLLTDRTAAREKRGFWTRLLGKRSAIG